VLDRSSGANQHQGRQVAIAVGDIAPDFELKDQHGKAVKLSDFHGKAPVVLMFYPFAFSSTCTSELCEIRDAHLGDGLVGDGRAGCGDAVVLAVSTDPVHALRAFSDTEGFKHPLLSDFWPHGEVAKKYGVFLDDLGFATRGTFVIDKDGVVRWAVVNGPGDARPVADYQAALAAL
jgi:peroxiredoxin